MGQLAWERSPSVGEDIMRVCKIVYEYIWRFRLCSLNEYKFHLSTERVHRSIGEDNVVFLLTMSSE